MRLLGTDRGDTTDAKNVDSDKSPLSPRRRKYVLDPDSSWESGAYLLFTYSQVEYKVNFPGKARQIGRWAAKTSFVVTLWEGSKPASRDAQKMT